VSGDGSRAAACGGGVSGVRSDRVTERLLIPAAFITTSGNAFQMTAAAILVFRSGQSALAVGWLFIAVSIPQVALSLVFGRVADRFDRRMLSVLSDVVSAVTACALPVWLWWHGSATLGSYLCNFLLACSAALFMPASNALVRERVREERLVKYNAAFEAANNAGMLLASACAGFLVVLFGPSPLFVFNAGTFVLSAVLTYLIGAKPKSAESPVEAEAAAEVAVSGLARQGEPEAVAPVPAVGLVSRGVLVRLGLLFTSGNVNLMVANMLQTTLILGVFHQGAWMIGVVDALAGAGFIVGAWCHGWLAARFSGLRIVVFCSLVCCLTIVLEPVGPVVFLCMMPVAGFFFVNFRIAARTLLMKASAPARVGRVFGTAQAGGLALAIAGTLVLGTLVGHTSVPLGFYVLAALLALGVLGCAAGVVRALAAAAGPAGTPAGERVLVAEAG
jgi:hypothetical protein